MFFRSTEIDEYVRQKEATFITPDIIAAMEQGTITANLIPIATADSIRSELVQDMNQFLRKKVRDVKEDEWRFNAKFNNSFM